MIPLLKRRQVEAAGRVPLRKWRCALALAVAAAAVLGSTAVAASSAWYGQNNASENTYYYLGGYWYYDGHSVDAGVSLKVAYAGWKTSGGSWNTASSGGSVSQTMSSSPTKTLRCKFTAMGGNSGDIDCISDR